MKKKYDVAVFIGRFQPFHNGHLSVVLKAKEIADTVLIIIGSVDKPRTYKNPFSFDERKEMIEKSLRYPHGIEVGKDLVIRGNVDTIYNDTAWATRIQEIVSDTTQSNNVCLIGHKKDDSSYYLDMFPQWHLEEVEAEEYGLSATEIREKYFSEEGLFSGVKVDDPIPYGVFTFLTKTFDREAHQQIVRERRFIENYKKQYEDSPYPPVFVTTDAIVTCCSHILLIRRKSEPGKGLWALPGGFLNANTDASLQSACIRELKEETGVKVPIPVLIGSIKGSHCFDAIARSARGRTITHAYHFDLKDKTLPKVKGMDDAEKAKWVALSDVCSREMFEDHYEIINYFMGTPILN